MNMMKIIGVMYVKVLCLFSDALSASSFFENLSRILTPNYIPTEMDVLKVRVRTCGIIETQFQVNRMFFR